MWFKNKHSGGGARTRSCSGPFPIQAIGSENVIHPHLLAISVPSALSSTDPTSIETISSDDNAVFKCKKRESKSRFLRQPKKISQGRTFQKIKHWKEGKSGSASSNEDVSRNAGKSFRPTFIENRKSRGRSYSSSAMFSAPVRDLQMFGSVPPTPTFNDDIHLKFSSNGFRNKSATLPSSNGSNLVSMFGKIAIDKFNQASDSEVLFDKPSNISSPNTLVNCPCSSCKEKRWMGAAGNHYQFPARSQSDWVAVDSLRRRHGLYYNSNPATGIDFQFQEPPLSVESKRYLGKQNPVRDESSAFVYANLDAIQNANGEIVKSKTNRTNEVNHWRSRILEEFHSFPRSFVKPFHHRHQAHRTVSESEAHSGLLTDVLCPCCGNVFHYNISKEMARANLRRRGLALSEPSTPTSFLRDNSLHNIFQASKLLSLIPSSEAATDVLPDYLKPNKTEPVSKNQIADNTSLGISSKECSCQTPISEVQLLYLVPPPQCHSPETVLKFNAYENGEYWKNKIQSNASDNQMNYITYVRSDSNGESSKQSSSSGDPDKEIPSFENRGERMEETEAREDLISGVDVSKYEIKKERTDQAGSSIYLRPRPQEPSSNFPYVWLLPSEESDDSLKCSKFKKPTFPRLPPLKENVAFYT